MHQIFMIESRGVEPSEKGTRRRVRPSFRAVDGRRTMFLALALACAASACKVRTLDVAQGSGTPPGSDASVGKDRVFFYDLPPYTINYDGSGVTGESIIRRTEGGGTCVGTTESCNGLDDDCDGVIDNGFDINADPANCGNCGTICSFRRAEAKCVAGACMIGSCNPGYVDLDKDPNNGCECMQTNGGHEVCDGADNDCDGLIDEDFNLQTDVNNCGKCGVTCGAAHESAACEQGACKYQCLPGYIDLNGKPEDGCEYPCVPSGQEVCDGKDNDCDGTIDVGAVDVGGACEGGGGCQKGVLTCLAGKPVCVGAGQASEEVCDGRDNDCDGQVDESDPNLNKVCYPPNTDGCNFLTNTCQGVCQFGQWQCSSAALSCTGAITPQLEVCDGKDNDCDGKIDEDFDLQNDPKHCGTCTAACAYQNAVALCTAGGCKMGPCLPGWVDADKSPVNGCEYSCTPDGPEVCDGKDNDCNKLVDEADPGILYPVTNFCRTLGECGKGPGGSTHFAGAASYPVCTTATGASKPDWICNYPSTVQLVGPNQVVAQESWCDGLDNDCDGAVDEHASDLGTTCGDTTGLGECKRSGTIKCQADKTLAPACDLTGAGGGTATDEVCDGKDNDCDGLVDESWDNPAGLGLPQCSGHDCLGVRDAEVHVSTASPAYYMYKYESSRVDANATSAGAAGTRACSRATNGSAQVLPWSSVDWTTASNACKAAGMRLCKAAEWTFACEGTCTADGCFPYGTASAPAYDSTKCNGADKNLNAAVTVGSMSQCTTTKNLSGTSTDVVYDLSGNLAEWTDECTTTSGRHICTTRGGAFDSYYLGMRCDFTGSQLGDNFSHPDTGFRCCSSCSPGQAECNGACKNLGTDNSNCGACGAACGAGKTCKNGTCQ